MAVDLFKRSVQIILKNQSPSGAYIASPAFPTYAYCWLRDGTYVAHAMDRVGHPESAAAFFRWVGQTIKRYAGKVEKVVAYQESRRPLDSNEFLHTRYNLDGSEVEGVEWSNFQIDGYGTWLWGLAEHVRRTGERRLLAELAESVRLTVRYLAAVWCLPNSDCWEEHPEYQHPYSLAAVYGGLQAAVRLAEMGLEGLPLEEITGTAQAVGQFVRQYGVKNGRLIKHIRPLEAGEHDHDDKTEEEGVDASLLGACTPYGLFLPNDPIWQATLEKIEHDLHRPGGGVYRYLGDTYYGGGEWVLLAGWLGWAYAGAGQPGQAGELLEWIEAQAGKDGSLPEQVSQHTLAPGYLPEWEQRWGPAADPLLWSHAKYLILHDVLS